MQKSFFSFLIFSLAFFGSYTSFGQLSNDECEAATVITDTNGCGSYSLTGATESGLSAPNCATDVNGDIWFAFTPTATSITITVNGASSSNPRGTLRSPVVTLYQGDCNSPNELRCGTDNGGSNFAELTQDGLFVGLQYFIRVDSRRTNGLGSFELCLNNFNRPAEPGGDCATRSLLCDKSSFTVESVSGAGNDIGEMDGAPCFVGAGTNFETNSTWFAWTADDNGTLEFTLTPLNITDDLDFVLYILPNGVDNCSNKSIIRCMASGFSSANAPCDGATGLRSSSNDFQEESGCDNGSDNFLAPVEMVAGQSYALVVNNFSGAGNGFDMSFGGTGNFRGPEPSFVTSPMTDICLGSPVSFTDASTYADGNIVSWAWTFGLGGDVQTATGQGPHSVNYSTPGTKQIVLTVESAQGCITTYIEEDFVIDPCCQTQNAISQTANITDSNCWDTNEGAISFAVSSNYGPHRILWDDGSSAPTRNNLIAGDYMVTVTGTYCDTVFTYTVDSPEPIESIPVIVMPTCDGGTDGSITLDPTKGTPGYEYQWDNSGTYVNANSLNNLNVGTYSLVIRDALGCDDTLLIEVNELELELVLGEDNVTMPTCAGFANGEVFVNLSNGSGPYTYDFGDGQGFLSNNTRDDLTAGNYTINVLDADRCVGQFEFEVTDHPALAISVDAQDISCNGKDDGQATAALSGGVDGYQYDWSNGSANSSIMNLTPGMYTVTGLDANGCMIDSTITIVEPGSIGVNIDDVRDVICFGDETGQISVSSIGGSGAFEYSIDNINFSSATLFDNLPAGDYTVIIRDVNLCTDDNFATITQPVELIVDAGQDQEIDLGFETNLSTTFSPFDRIVTYSWTPMEGVDCIDCPSTDVMPFITTDYIIRIEDQDNCEAFDTVQIVVNDVRPIFIPNVFTPNSDGSNDFLSIFSNIAATNIELFQVFDRWGNLMYEGEDLPLNDPSAGWDGKHKGKHVNTGVFVYQAKIRFLDDEVRTYSGDVTLLR